MILLWPNNRSPIINKVELHYLDGFCGVMMVIGPINSARHDLAE